MGAWVNNLSASDYSRNIAQSAVMIAAHIATKSQSGWINTRVGDIIAKISTGTTPPSTVERYYDGAIDWYTPSDIGKGRWVQSATRSVTQAAMDEKKARLFETETLLITCIGQIGRISITSSSCSANQQITGISFKPEISIEYAYFYFLANRQLLEDAAPASTLPILNQKRLKTLPFCYPSYEEQELIANFLSWYQDLYDTNRSITNQDWIPPLPNYLHDLPRIVAHIEALAQRIEEARGLRQGAIEEAEGMFEAEQRKSVV